MSFQISLGKIRILLVSTLLSAFQLSATSLSIQPVIDVNYRPDPASDEGGFWYQVEKIERDVQLSPYRIKDQELNEYVQSVVCRLTPEYCANIRVYIIDNPNFNAAMFPNGMMHIWSGVFLRLENEAQLASILGHEIGHYLQTHQIQQFRELKDASAAALVIDIAVGSLTGIVGLGTLLSGSALAEFGRDQEREADIIGLEMMGHAGYDTHESGQVWGLLIAEREADLSKEERSIFWATHPTSEERLSNLNNQSTLFQEKWQKEYTREENEFRKQVAKIYHRAMSNHLSLQEYEQTESILERHKNINYDPALIEYFYGELYRLRGEPGDTQLSISAYETALQQQSCPKDAHKQLGYLYTKEKNKKLAKKHFGSYLENYPEAEDKAMIKYYMELLN
ncbi:M48 family metallopeptidase [Planctobacterium marinum]|uniref:M48 family metallopeptidase n=1 Tax=Planctobacterium marinum TaxID=1631968 RepID=UPI001E5495A5|nr:M48 family metallopeptidase [Planctobacterium marinum]MCC2608152.1 M48 family metalloprotease [Planctobacterium marinum]